MKEKSFPIKEPKHYLAAYFSALLENKSCKFKTPYSGMVSNSVVYWTFLLISDSPSLASWTLVEYDIWGATLDTRQPIR